MKDHERRELVNNLRGIAAEFHASQQLRERISHCLVPVDALRDENAKLREQLAAQMEDNRRMVDKACDALQRAEAAEAKLKAAREQKPVAVFQNGATHCYAEPVTGMMLYAAPVPNQEPHP